MNYNTNHIYNQIILYGETDQSINDNPLAENKIIVHTFNENMSLYHERIDDN